MKLYAAISFGLVGLVGIVMASFSQAQQAGAAGPTAQQVQRKIGFRLASWKRLHLDDTPETQVAIDTLKKLGCEVTQSEHAGHIDVLFQCPNWKSMTVETDSQMVKWQNWLTSKGLETVIVNPPTSHKASTVRYRMTGPQSAHLHDSGKVEFLSSTYEMLGCQVKKNGHDGHVDLTVGCPNWHTIGLPNCRQAHAWQSWLNQNGFQTEHKH